MKNHQQVLQQENDAEECLNDEDTLVINEEDYEIK